jgi:hypothetical protein
MSFKFYDAKKSTSKLSSLIGSEFKIINAKGKENPQVVLKFADETTEPNEEGNQRRRGSTSTNAVQRANSRELSRSPSISTAASSSSPPSPDIVSKETGSSTSSTSTDPRARPRAKKAVKGLEITFYTQKGNVASIISILEGISFVLIYFTDRVHS